MTKHCPGCDRTLRVSQFHRDRTTEDGMCKLCIRCRSERRYRRGFEHRWRRRTGRYVTPERITCSQCGKQKKANEFPRNEDSRTGRGTKCKMCVNKYAAYMRRRARAQQEAAKKGRKNG